MTAEHRTARSAPLRVVDVVRVPASTSNLGPGFDAMGLALELYLRVAVRAIRPDRPGTLRATFASEPPPGDNLVSTGFAHFARVGRAAYPGLEVDIDSAIPIESGLGSSAAALVAGFVLAARLHPDLELTEIVDAATRLEGHPDNVTAAALGGMTVSAVDRDGRVHVVSRPWPTAVGIVVATPTCRLSTKRAREVLPDSVPFRDAVANVQRASLLVAALSAGSLGALREALVDRLHQPYRLDLVPGLRAALSVEHPALLGTFLSGAGPSVVTLVRGRNQIATVVELIKGAYDREGITCDVRPMKPHQPRRTPARGR